MQTSHKIVIGVLLLVLAAAVGRYTAPTKIETKTVTVEVEKVLTNTDTVIVEVVKPDGTRTTRTETHTVSDSTKNTKSKEEKLVESQTGKTNISILGGVDLSGVNLTYGASITRTILGPISIGVWGLIPSKTVGASVGIQF